jgi:hypothetical protein
MEGSLFRWRELELRLSNMGKSAGTRHAKTNGALTSESPPVKFAAKLGDWGGCKGRARPEAALTFEHHAVHLSAVHSRIAAESG